MILRRVLSCLNRSFYDLDDIHGIIRGLHYSCLHVSEHLVRTTNNNNNNTLFTFPLQGSLNLLNN